MLKIVPYEDCITNFRNRGKHIHDLMNPIFKYHQKVLSNKSVALVAAQMPQDPFFLNIIERVEIRHPQNLLPNKDKFLGVWFFHPAISHLKQVI